MTEEDKELLLRDLSARLPYGVRVFVSGDDFDNYQYPYLLTAISKFGQDIFCKIYSPIYTPLGCPGIENVKPYLFPLSSMTEEQRKEFLSVAGYERREEDCGRHTETYYYNMVGHEHEFYPNSDAIDYCNKNHLDYRGFIEKGLALDATGLNIYC